MSGLYVSTKFQNSKALLYFCNLPVTKQVTCSHFCAPVPWLRFRPLSLSYSHRVHCPIQNSPTTTPYTESY